MARPARDCWMMLVIVVVISLSGGSVRLRKSMIVLAELVGGRRCR